MNDERDEQAWQDHLWQCRHEDRKQARIGKLILASIVFQAAVVAGLAYLWF